LSLCYSGQNYESCENDDSIKDVDGQTCSERFDSTINTCDTYDTEEFKSTLRCCYCGGGLAEV
jgi:hypothetical protein